MARLRGNGNSRAGGVSHLDYYGRLVGVAPEARAAAGQLVIPTLEQAINAVLSVSGNHVPEVGKAGFGSAVSEALKPLYK